VAAVRGTGRQPVGAAQPIGATKQWQRLDALWQSGFIQRRAAAGVFAAPVAIRWQQWFKRSAIERTAVLADCASGSPAAVERWRLERSAQLFRWRRWRQREPPLQRRQQRRRPLVRRRKQQQGRQPPVRVSLPEKVSVSSHRPGPDSAGIGPFFSQYKSGSGSV
jgi:hypothetical protein